jgi:cytosine/adenosine deaminase-related metal-dependent hydrolase
MTLIALLLAAQASNVPAVPDDVPRSATFYDVLLLEKQAGQMAAWTTTDGKLHVFFQFNDRGRGPKTYSTYTMQGGLPVAVEVEGNDYMKDPVHESFEAKDGASSWKNKAEQGSRKISGPSFYPSMFGAPLESALLVTAALQNHGAIPLLPEGEARVRKIAARPEATLYAVTGLDFAPNYLWLDSQARLFAIWSGWFTLVRAGRQAAMPALIRAQKKVMSELERDRARRLQHRPKGKLLLRDAGVFDAESARVEPHRDVLVEGNRILSVTPAQAEVPAGVEVIDARGKTLLPGLWDMHAHVADNDGLLNLAAGVTTVRDLANDNDELAARIARIEMGEELGTRVVRAGFIDGPGPYQGPTKVLVATKEEAVKWVDWYADHGFVQIKLYSSLKPELVPVVAEEAHRRGLRLSGHIPSGMLAAQAVREGYDEIQHVNFLLLNFMPDVTETRTPARFLEPARRAADLDLSSPAVREFIALLKDRHTALDLTLATFENMFLARPGAIPPGSVAIAARLPAQIRRGLLAGELPMSEGTDERYKASWNKVMKLVHELWAAGIPIEAGTDGLAGFTLHRELELDVQAGIPAERVLQLATLGAARTMGLDKDLGLIRPGKLADLVLVDGDPLASISDVRKTVVTIKDGAVYEAAALYRELGVAAR